MLPSVAAGPARAGLFWTGVSDTTGDSEPRVAARSPAQGVCVSDTSLRQGGGAAPGRPYDASVILDGHNDLVLKRWRGDEPAHVHLDRAAQADFCGGFFALYVPSPSGSHMAAEPPLGPYDFPLDPAIPPDVARRVAAEQ